MSEAAESLEERIELRVASTPHDQAGHFNIRQRVFVAEQGIFIGSDRDAQDDDPRTIHLIARVDEEVAGAVRLYPLDVEGRTWQGDRLAVLREFRAGHLGGDLVRQAVATGGAFGGEIMHAHVQLSNVRFFEHLGWSVAGSVETYVGHRHQPMSITLSRA